MRLARKGLPSLPLLFDSTADVTGFGGRAPSGIGFITDAGGIPAHGNQRSEWDAGCRFDFPNPEHR